MTEQPLCPKCGTQLPADAPAGLCPKCLVQAGLESEPGPHPRPAATVSSAAFSGFEPLSVESLAGKFPQLEILELLGKGGMGAVYKARQRGLDRLVAVKVLPPEIGHDPAFAERFTREAKALARLSHNHIVSVFDFGQSDGLYYIVMEFVDGVNLRQTIQTGKLTPQEALAIVPQICEALQFAHDEGIVHRDIKPENILIDKRGRVKIADFGLAKLMASGGRESPDILLTAPQQVMGTLRYMAPEQMQGSREVDHRADIYSLGVIFYELLTGEVPMGKFAPPSKRVQVDVRLDEVVLRALEQQPEQRYQHASELQTDLEAVVRGKPTTPSAVNPVSGLPIADHSLGTATGPHLVQAPADCLLLVAGIAFVTALGVIVWLLAMPASSSNQVTNLTIRGNLTGMLVALATYSLFIGVAGWMMRMLRARLFVLLVAVVVGLFFPAVVALNVLMEFRNIPVWPAVIPLWIGMPVALWVAVTLFRDDVRRAFAGMTPQQAPRDTADRTRRLIDRTAEGLWFLAAAALFSGVVILYFFLRLGARHSFLELGLGHLGFGLVLAVAGLNLRLRHARLLVLILLVIFAVCVPFALTIILGETEWETVKRGGLGCFWAGFPLGLWTIWLLLREDVQAAFAAGAGSFKVQPVIPEPRFSRFAIAGAVWALFGVLAIIPTLFFIGLNRVWNGTALPTDVIYEQPPLTFTIFMGALLAIGAGAPIGTTIYGAFAISHIKRSGGKIIGLPLAVADVLFFPLLGVFVGIAVPVSLALHSLLPFQLIAVAVPSAMFALTICLIIGFAVWRTIARRPTQL